MKIYDEDGQVSLFAPDGCAGKMFQARSAAGHPKGRTSGSSSRKSSELKAIPFMSLDLTPGRGNLLGESYWELISPLRGGSSMLNTGPAPLNAEDVFSLSQILQADPPQKYYLSRTACLGILRRAEERKKELPPQLKAALMAQAGLQTCHINQRHDGPVAFAANQRDEVRDLHDVAGAVTAQPGMKQQTFIAEGALNPWDTQQKRIFHTNGVAPTLAGADGGGGRNPGGLLLENEGCLNPWDTQQKRIFTPDDVSPTLSGVEGGGWNPAGLLFAAFCAGAGAKARGIGYSEKIAPTLKGAAGGNCMPSVLCLNDQGGSAMSCSENVTGTLRAQEHGHQPLLFENHGIDARYTGPHPVSPTITTRAGTGGGNLPLVADDPCYCITGNAIDRQPQNGGNGIGFQEGIAYTLTATDHHAVYSRQRVDVFKHSEVVSTESARQYKDATDLVCQPAYQDTVGALTSSDRKGPNNQYVGQDKLIVEGPLLIRRLTPLECERLQGYPDFWTELPNASDSARYRALGNSIAVPCVEYIMRGITKAAHP